MAENTERLLLQVDAATELLRRHLTEAEQPLDRFERRADRMVEQVDRAIGGMGGRFGAFAALADDAAKRAEKSFEASFTQVQRIAAQAVKGPTVDARADLGIEGLRAQAAAAQDQARSFELIAAAAERASGGSRHASEASYLFIQATNASRIGAEQKAAALLAEAGALERVQIELLRSAEATEHFVTRHQRVAEAEAAEKRLAIATAEAATEQRALAAAANLLRASIDPMFAAQQRFDQEMIRAETLLRAGAISQRDYATASDLARTALNQQAMQLSGSAAAATRAIVVQQQLTNETQQLRAALDPMFSAQQRFDQELDRADRLLAAGAISTREYASALQMARNNLYEHARGLPVASANTAQLTEEQRRSIAVMGTNRMAMQGLSYQAQDTFTQLSMGANVFNVIAIQGAQAAGQLSFLRAEAGTALARVQTFSNFMLGPWGLAITAAMFIVGALTKNMRFFTDETGDAVRKLEKDAQQVEITSDAKARFGRTLAGVTAAIRDQNKALTDSAAAETDATERANIDANSRARQAAEIRKVTAARLADALAAREALDDSAFANTDPRAAAVAKRVRDEDVAGLRAQLAAADAAVDLANANVNRTRVDLAAAAAKRMVDPLARINRLYDEQARAIRNAARAAAQGGAIVTAGLTRQLAAIERNRAAALAAEQARQNAGRGSGNRQFGREVDVAGATAIVSSIGGRVTSGLRSRQRQAELYADAQAGRHVGPVAKPGTSAHERGQAIDVAYGPGISVAAIRKAFADAGVTLRKVLNEPGQRVYHVEYGKAGPSAATVGRRAEAARTKLLRDDSAFAGDLLQARRRLIDATTRGADSEAERDALLREEIDAEAGTARRKLADRLKAGDLTDAQARQLGEVNEATRRQRLQNVRIEAATRSIDRQYQARAEEGQARLEILRLQQGMAITDADRNRIGRQILDLEQQLRRATLERVRDTSQDAEQVQGARTALGRLPALERTERDAFDAGQAGPIEQYRQRLVAATDDMGAALEGVAVRGFGALEEAGAREIANILKIKGAFGQLASSMIADLARIAIQKAILSALPGVGSFLGFADGGRIPAFADGGPSGRIRGPGSGRSDSILARVSNGEYIINAAATARHLPLIEAINANRLPAFASGGPVTPRLSAPRLPDLSAAQRGARQQVDVTMKVAPSPLFTTEMTNVSARVVTEAAPAIADMGAARALSLAGRPRLGGGHG